MQKEEIFAILGIDETKDDFRDMLNTSLNKRNVK
mgnify:CR=1 FL=1